MKRNILRLFALAVASMLAFASCSDELTKAEVEAGFSGNSANIPSVTIGDLTLTGKGQTVAISGTSVSTSGELLEVGFEFCPTADFEPTKTTYSVVEDPSTIGAYTSTTLSAATTYYVRAYAIVGEGMAYSEVKEFTTLDLPLIDKVCGTWAGTLVSYLYGDAYSVNLVVEPGEQEGTVVIYNIEPYYVSKGYVNTNPKAAGFNYVTGVLDAENERIVVQFGSDIHLGGRTIAGLNAASYPEATGYSHVYFQSKGGGSQLYLVNGWMTMTPDGAEDAYDGDVTFKRK